MNDDLLWFHRAMMNRLSDGIDILAQILNEMEMPEKTKNELIRVFDILQGNNSENRYHYRKGELPRE